MTDYDVKTHGNNVGLSWGANGKLAATTGPLGQVTVYDTNGVGNRLMKDWTAQNNDRTMVSHLCYSPQGDYLCSVSCEGEILIYSSRTGESVKESAHDCRLSAVAWNGSPSVERGHQIVFLDTQGQLALWEGAVPLGGPGAVVEEPEEMSVDEEDLKQAARRLLKRVGSVLDSDDESAREEETEMEKVKKQTVEEEDEDLYAMMMDTATSSSLPKTTGMTMQEAFQVASVPEQKQMQCLNWTLHGKVIATVEEERRTIDITLNDSSKPQPKRITDHFFFTRAALGENGAVFSSEVDERVPATVFYQPFETWTSNSEWRVQLDYSEQVLGLALGSGFVAIATDQLSVRILTTGGIQCGLFSLPGPFLCTSAFQDKLAVVYHRAAPFGMNQNLSILVYDFQFK